MSSRAADKAVISLAWAAHTGSGRVPENPPRVHCQCSKQRICKRASEAVHMQREGFSLTIELIDWCRSLFHMAPAEETTPSGPSETATLADGFVNVGGGLRGARTDDELAQAVLQRTNNTVRNLARPRFRVCASRAL